MIAPPALTSELARLQIHVAFPHGSHVTEEIILRWIHFVFGITWIGLLYFFNLVSTPVMKRLDAATRQKLVAEMMPRALAWFRWSALITVLAGLRYYILILQEDAWNAGRPGLAWHWLGIWFAVWLVAYALIHGLMMPTSGPLNRGWLRALLIAIVAAGAAYTVLALIATPESSNGALSIAVGGGLGLVMLFDVWGFVWRAQKRLIAWTRASIEQGAPMPAEAAPLARRAFIGARTGFWLSFPMLFFMAAADHYPFLSTLVTWARTAHWPYG
jgi:uncharacterized membrane protein